MECVMCQGKEDGWLCLARTPCQKDGGLCEGAYSRVTSCSHPFPEGGSVRVDTLDVAPWSCGASQVRAGVS